MPISSWKTGLLVSGLLTAMVAGCSNEQGKSSLVDITITPTQPIVISADSASKKAPWFDFKVTVTNSSTATLKIVALKVELELAQGGLKASSTHAFSPSDFSEAFSTETSVCVYDDFGSITAGQTKELFLTNRGTGTTCPTNSAVSFTVTEGAKISGSSNYRYRGKVTPEGWFENSDGSYDRFTRYGTFTTQ